MKDNHTPGEEQKYFSYDHEDGVEFHHTAKEAKRRAAKSLDADRDYAGEGWAEEVDDICWGKILGQVVETERRPIQPEDGLCGFDEYVDYQLLDTHAVECAEGDLLGECFDALDRLVYFQNGPPSTVIENEWWNAMGIAKAILAKRKGE